MKDDAIRDRIPAGDTGPHAYALLLLFVILAAGIVGAGYLYFRNYENNYRAEVGRQLSAIGACEDEDPGDSVTPGVARCTDRLQNQEPEGGNPWWKATPEEIAEFYCESCQAKVPLWRERRRMKARLSGLMAAMRAAYRRERGKP